MDQEGLSLKGQGVIYQVYCKILSKLNKEVQDQLTVADCFYQMLLILHFS